MSEGYKFTDIEKARVNPSKELDRTLQLTQGLFRTQALKLKNYILQILRDYNTMINYENVVDMPIELKEMITNQKKIDIARLAESMPKFGNEFMILDSKLMYSVDSESYANALLEYLASMVITIHNKRHEKYKLLADAFIKYVSHTLIEQEKLFSKAESILAKATADISTIESDSEDEVAVSGDEYTGVLSEKSASEFEDDVAAEKNEGYVNDIDNDAFDVEEAGDIWEIE